MPPKKKNSEAVILDWYKEMPKKYLLKGLLAGTGYLDFIKKNVEDSDGTVLFTYGKPIDENKKTIEYAEELKKPIYCIDLADANMALSEATRKLAFLWWIKKEKIKVLNVAGSIESKAEGVQETVEKFLINVFKANKV